MLRRRHTLRNSCFAFVLFLFGSSQKLRAEELDCETLKELAQDDRKIATLDEEMAQLDLEMAAEYEGFRDGEVQKKRDSAARHQQAAARYRKSAESYEARFKECQKKMK